MTMIGSFLTLTVFARLLPLAIALSVDVAQDREQTLSERGSVRHKTTTSGPLTVECDADKYGGDLQFSSCLQAFAELSQDARAYTWGPRGSHMEIITPRRILSHDARCYFEIVQGNSTKTVGQPNMIRNVAGWILETCGESKLGGVVEIPVTTGLLNLTMGSYEPHITCNAEPIDTDPLAIRSLLTEMPVNKARTTFGLPPLDEHGMVQLPMGVSVNHGGRGIIAMVDVDGRTEVSSWYEIWEAYHAIANLCIAREHTGFARIGDHRRLIVSIKSNRSR